MVHLSPLPTRPCTVFCLSLDNKKCGKVKYVNTPFAWLLLLHKQFYAKELAFCYAKNDYDKHCLYKMLGFQHVFCG